MKNSLNYYSARTIRFFLVLIIPCMIIYNTSTRAEVLNVPVDYSTIQEAIDNAVVGDTVLVAPGTYFENINYRGKNITVTSQYILDYDTSFINTTIIDGSQPDHPDTASCVLFISGENNTAVLAGFTITGGKGTIWEDEHGPGYFYREGGGILIQNSSPTIRNNVIISNEAYNSTGIESAGGGGIRSGDGKPHILNNIITFNKGRYGGGLVFNYSGGIVKNNIIWNNKGGEDHGGSGVWIYGNSVKKLIVQNNTIVGNISKINGGGIRALQSNPVILNNIVYGNIAYNYDQILSSSITISYCNVQDGYSGDYIISDYPEFDTTNFYLLPSSSCIDAGNPDAIYNDIQNINTPGMALWPSQGSLTNDIGAYGGAGVSIMPEMSFPILYVPDTVIDFGNIEFGDTVITEIVIHNMGSSTLNITNCMIIPVLDSSITFEHNIEGIINPMQNDTLKIKWIQNTLDTLTGEIMLYHNDTAYMSPVIVHFNGTASPGSKILNISPDKLQARIFPNPISNNQFTLEIKNTLPGELSITIYNLIGQEVYSENIIVTGQNSVRPISLNNSFRNGIYFLKLELDNMQKCVKKLIIN